MPGVMKVLVGGAWVDLGVTGPEGPRGPEGPPGDEIFIGAYDPGVNSGYDFWVDTSMPTPTQPIPFGMARGLIGFTLLTASGWTNATTSPTSFTVTTGTAPLITFTGESNRIYLARWRSSVQSTAAGDIFVPEMSVTGLTTQNGALRFGAAATAELMWMERIFERTGATTVEVKGRRSLASTGTMSIAGVTASTPMVLTLQDIGGY